mmetsp:Transcript_38181/g.94712  ORF Transcript_38181/g.94712 Transcript_38181/m.94712 type:complete len:227 (-) Transcript_38181:356-1036(-)
MAPRFLRGFFLWATYLEVVLEGRRADWTSVELMMRPTSALAIRLLGSLYPFFRAAASVPLPHRASSLPKAASVQTTRRPMWEPGASCSRFRPSTLHSSTPGRLRKARSTLDSASCTMRGPHRWTYRRLRSLPLPARILRDPLDLATSPAPPRVARVARALAVLVTPPRPETTRGSSTTSSVTWPRAWTRGVTAVAAMAAAAANRRWFTAIFRCHLRQILVGANMRP